MKKWASEHASAGWSTGIPPTPPPQVPVGPELYVSQPKSEGRSSLLECLDGLLSGHVPQMSL